MTIVQSQPRVIISMYSIYLFDANAIVLDDHLQRIVGQGTWRVRTHKNLFRMFADVFHALRCKFLGEGGTVMVGVVVVVVMVVIR